jgi:hypothetical protein
MTKLRGEADLYGRLDYSKRKMFQGQVGRDEGIIVSRTSRQPRNGASDLGEMRLR